MGSEEIVNNAFAIFGLIFMLIADTIFWPMISNMANLSGDNVVKWILLIMGFLGMMIATFGIPLLISLNKNVSIINAIAGVMYLILGLPVSYVILSFMWDFANTWITPHGGQEVLLILQILMIVLALGFGFFIPALVMLGDFE